MEEEKLVSQMEYARFEHETEMLRERNYAAIYSVIQIFVTLCVRRASSARTRSRTSKAGLGNEGASTRRIEAA